MNTAKTNKINSPASPLVVMSERSPWQRRSVAGLEVWTIGDDLAVRAVVDACASNFSLENTAAEASKQTGSFAAIIQSASGVLALTDHCQSFPVFHANNGGAIIGNDARAVRDAAGLATFDRDSVREAAMAGFVTGPNTLVEGLCQLNPGEVIFIPNHSANTRTRRTFTYAPQTSAGATEAELSAQLDAATNAAIDRVITMAGNSPVWVPLSGGLDSRLVLAKLRARGCANLHSFSYGPRGNPDAMIARAVADRLDVPWHFIATSGTEMRRFFAGKTRHDYWGFADGLSSVPNNQDLLPVIHLRERGLLANDAIIVNGQTGDFISGGHIPETLFDDSHTVGSLLDAIVARHYSLWNSLLTPENVATAVRRIRAVLHLEAPADAPLERDTAIAMWERFEYESRQARYIVNGQRIYDFLGLRWALPLWDGDVVGFWRDVPTALKRNQRLYRETWNAWDYKGVFSMPTRPVTAWSRPLSSVIVPLSIITRLIMGRARRDRWMTYARYLDRFGSHYQAFGWRTFARHAPDARNPVSYYTRAWLKDLGIPWPDERAAP